MAEAGALTGSPSLRPCSGSAAWQSPAHAPVESGVHPPGPSSPAPPLLRLGQPPLPPLAGLQLALGLVQGVRCGLSPPLPEPATAHPVAGLVLDGGSGGWREAQHASRG